jgi:hypothetical protein
MAAQPASLDPLPATSERRTARHAGFCIPSVTACGLEVRVNIIVNVAWRAGLTTPDEWLLVTRTLESKTTGGEVPHRQTA